MSLEITRVVFGKWALDVLVLLYSLRTLGFEAIRKNLRGISFRVLSEKLKRLEENGLIRREVQDTRPVRVLYRLTEVGLMSAKLGEPVILYLRYKKGLYLKGPPSGTPRSALFPPSLKSSAIQKEESIHRTGKQMTGPSRSLRTVFAGTC